MTPSAPAIFPHVVAWLEDAVARHRPKRVLEAGCGGGQYRRFFDPGSYVGFDVPETWYEEVASPDVFASSDALPFKDSQFDVIFSVSAFDYFPNPQETLKEMRRCMRSTGRVMIFTYDEQTLKDIHERTKAVSSTRAVDHHHVFDRELLGGYAASAGLSLTELPLEPRQSLVRKFKRRLRPTNLRVFELSSVP